MFGEHFGEDRNVRMVCPTLTKWGKHSFSYTTKLKLRVFLSTSAHLAYVGADGLRNDCELPKP